MPPQGGGSDGRDAVRDRRGCCHSTEKKLETPRARAFLGSRPGWGAPCGPAPGAPAEGTSPPRQVWRSAWGSCLDPAPQRRALRCRERGLRGSSLSQQVPSAIGPSVSLVKFVAVHGSKYQSKHRPRPALEGSYLLSGRGCTAFVPVRAAQAPLQGRVLDLGAVFLSSAAKHPESVFSICIRAPTSLGRQGHPGEVRAKSAALLRAKKVFRQAARCPPTAHESARSLTDGGTDISLRSGCVR